VIFFFPSLLGTVAVALMWTQFYDPKGGLINGVLTRLGLDQFNGFTWLSAEQFHWKWLSDHFFGFDIPMNHLYWALIPMTVWGGCGFNMVLYLAAMQNVPEELYEAAEIEGASAWKQFWTITLPMIWDVLIVSVIFLIIAGMKVFDIVWLLTNQLPSTDVNVIGTRVVQTMFTEFNIGEATAMAVILFVLVFVGSATVMRLMQRETIES
jgi:raffinose/stachyose/melibiose transport system permease protein